MIEISNDQSEIRDNLIYRLNDDLPFTGVLNYFGSQSDYILKLKIDYINGKKDGLTEIITTDCRYTKKWINETVFKSHWKWQRSIDPQVIIQKGTQTKITDIHKNGFWQERGKRLTFCSEGTYTNGEKDGVWTLFKHGRVVSIGSFKKNQKDGMWIQRDKIKYGISKSISIGKYKKDVKVDWWFRFSRRKLFSFGIQDLEDFLVFWMVHKNNLTCPEIEKTLNKKEFYQNL